MSTFGTMVLLTNESIQDAVQELRDLMASDTIPPELAIKRAAGKALKPFDENQELTPYRDYLDMEPEDHDFVTYLYQATDPYNQPPLAGIGDLLTVQKTDIEVRKTYAHRLDALRDQKGKLHWLAVIKIYNQYYADSPHETALFYDKDIEKPYTISTVNPQGHYYQYEYADRLTTKHGRETWWAKLDNIELGHSERIEQSVSLYKLHTAVTTDGRWLSSSTLGWGYLEMEQLEQYNRDVVAEIKSLRDEDIIVSVTCHT